MPFYPIIDSGLCRTRGIDPRALAEACFRGGARWLQIRHKASAPAGRDPGSGEFLLLADAIARIATRFEGARVIVNDRADICRMAHCAGVHVGQDDLPV